MSQGPVVVVGLGGLGAPIAMGVTLVTNNEADFVGYPGLVVENWVRSA